MKSLWKTLLYVLFFLSCIGLCILYYMVRNYSFISTYTTMELEKDHPYDGQHISTPRVHYYKEGEQEILRTEVQVEDRKLPKAHMSTPRVHYYKKGEQEILRTEVQVEDRKLPKVPANTRKSSIQKKDTRSIGYQHKQVEGYGKLVKTMTVKERIPEHEYYTTSQEKEQMHKPDLYVFSLSYMDQMTWASTRWRSLQCWVSKLSQRYSIHVIEPFVTVGTHLGVPTLVNQSQHEVLKFGDIFDTSPWQRRASNGPFPFNIVSWEAFLSSGARNVVAVQMVYPYHYHCIENRQTDQMCNNKRMQRLFSQHLALNNFTLMKSICINFRELDILTMEQFNDMIFDNIPENLPVTIMFDEWRGLGEKSCIARVKGGNCSVYDTSFINVTLNLMTPSLKVNNAARRYIHRYIHQHVPNRRGYAAIVIRWEKILTYDFYSYHNASRHYTGSHCIKKILKYVKEEVHKKRHIKASFLTTDIGKFGSSTYTLYNSTRTSTSVLRKYTQRLLGILHNSESLRLNEYEDRFEKISGTTNPAFISQLQKSIAARARCLLLVGWGNFLTNTLDIYRSMHKGKLCYKRIMLC